MSTFVRVALGVHLAALVAAVLFGVVGEALAPGGSDWRDGWTRVRVRVALPDSPALTLRDETATFSEPAPTPAEPSRRHLGLDVHEDRAPSVSQWCIEFWQRRRMGRRGDPSACEFWVNLCVFVPPGPIWCRLRACPEYVGSATLCPVVLRRERAILAEVKADAHPTHNPTLRERR